MTGVTSARGTLGDHALAYAARGIKVFPLWWAVDGVCVCSDGRNCPSPAKHPRVPRWINAASASPDRVDMWWSMWPHANVGMPAGDNGLAVLDVDPRHGGDDNLATLAQWCLERHGIDLLSTRTIGTGSGGLHLYFRQPVGGIKSTAKAFEAPGLDTRGRGGYVVAPPSVHVSGGRYAVTSDVEPQPWPDVLTRLMQRPPPAAPAGNSAAPARPPAASNAERWARRGLDAECEQLRNLTTAPEGSGRNNALNGAAYKIGRRVGGRFLTEHEAATALFDAVRGWPGHSERELSATIASGLRAGMAKPHNGPARGQA